MEDKQKIVGFMVVGPNEPWLERVLEQRREQVDDMIICGNNTDPATEELIKSYGWWFYRDDREWGVDQPRIKQDLLAKVLKLKPDWILATDADELFEEALTDEELQKLIQRNVIGYRFAIFNLWNDEEHYRHDLSFWNVRLWNVAKAREADPMLKFSGKSLHCGLAPAVVYYSALNAPFILKHYGLLTATMREAKSDRYKKYDPSAKYISKQYYDSLDDERCVFSFDEKAMHERVASDVTKFGYKPKGI